MQRQIIGLMGVKGCGKDTFAQHFVQNHGFCRIGFADELYRQVAAAFGVTESLLGERATKELPLAALALRHCSDGDFVRCVLETNGWQDGERTRAQPLSPRMVMQLWGDEYRRQRGVDNYWLQIVEKAMRATPALPFVVTDVRYPNEMAFLRSKGATLVRLRRSVQEAREAEERLSNGRALHASETALLNTPADCEVVNIEGHPERLRQEAALLVSRYKQQHLTVA